jgi:SpoVK/Ycf46/Vps4 family AAA+-type ATPase
MDQDKLQRFVDKILNLDAPVPGTGISSGGLFGAASSRQDALDSLKRKVLSFAREHRQRSPDKKILAQFSQEVEGNLQVLNSLAVIDDNALDTLIDELHELQS